MLVMESESSSSTIPSNGNNQLNQYVLLAKQSKEVALKDIVMQAIEATEVYFFGELLELTCIQNMKDKPDAKKYFDVLHLFAYGTYKEYIENKGLLPDLTPSMQKKLRYLTVVTLASDIKMIPYSTLLEELDISSIRELEDLLIAAVYANIVKGKLDQQNSRLEVDWAIGRDLKPNDMEYIEITLEKWEGACKNILQTIVTEVSSANAAVTEEKTKQDRIEYEISNIKKTIKATLSQQDMDLTTSDNNTYSSTSSNAEVKSKKSRIKGLRGSSKLWTKN